MGVGPTQSAGTQGSQQGAPDEPIKTGYQPDASVKPPADDKRKLNDNKETAFNKAFDEALRSPDGQIKQAVSPRGLKAREEKLAANTKKRNEDRKIQGQAYAASFDKETGRLERLKDKEEKAKIGNPEEELYAEQNASGKSDEQLVAFKDDAQKTEGKRETPKASPAASMTLDASEKVA